MSDAFQMWCASRGIPLGVRSDEAAMREAFEAGMRIATARDRRIERLVTLAAGVAARGDTPFNDVDHFAEHILNRIEERAERKTRT